MHKLLTMKPGRVSVAGKRNYVEALIPVCYSS
jgi:hypothetical protein